LVIFSSSIMLAVADQMTRRRTSLSAVWFLMGLLAWPVLADEALHWDALSKRCEVKRGQTNATFVFQFANATGSELSIRAVRPSCACTTARLPSDLPWRVAPGASDKLELNVDVRDRWESFDQTVSIETSAGTNRVVLKVQMPELASREKDRRTAFADRQAVFKERCAECHLRPAQGKPTEQQYPVLCGTCHDSRDRAEMVPDLKEHAKERNRNDWERLVRRGKPGTFMPGFAKPFGGPLTEPELQNLVNWLTNRFQREQR
jgi:mono/diheme cytochrome c family protein